MIYSLPTVRALGGGVLYLAPNNRADCNFPRSLVEQMGTLLRSQSYLRDVQIWDGHKSARYNLDRFREGNVFSENLADLHLKAFDLPTHHRNTAWLEIPPLVIPGKDVVFQRTPRYRNGDFSWQHVWQEHGQRAVFVGTREEHAAFEAQIGLIDCFVAHDFLEMASLIRGARLFVGNQSCGYAMAEAMHHPNVILEVCPSQPTNIFDRPGVRYCWRYP